MLLGGRYSYVYWDEYISVIVSFRTCFVYSKMQNHPRGLELPFLQTEIPGVTLQRLVLAYIGVQSKGAEAESPSPLLQTE